MMLTSAILVATSLPEPLVATSEIPFTMSTLIACITVFVLAIFLGFELISKVPPTLHTPLMSGANAISGITIVGALILSNFSFNGGNAGAAAWLAFAALVMATINVVGGFMVTNRMLEMIAGKRKRKQIPSKKSGEA